MTVSEKVGTIQKLESDFKAFEENFTLQARNAFNEAVKEFFDKTPEVKAIYWLQYTPYFNDGDACEFGVHDPSFISEEQWEEFQDNRGEYGYGEKNIWEKPSDWTYEAAAKKSAFYWASCQEEIDKYNMLTEKLGPRFHEVAENIKAVKKLWSIDNRVFLAAFGDHASVLLTRDGADVDEYEHD